MFDVRNNDLVKSFFGPKVVSDWDPRENLPKDFVDVRRRVSQLVGLNREEDSSETNYIFSKENPFFEKGAAWLKWNDHRARLAGFFHPEFHIDGEATAFFGYWETINNISLNKKLFKEFEFWAKAKGAKKVVGPINFSILGPYRLRLSHFDQKRWEGEPDNAPYYVEFMNRMGYEVEQQYASYLATDHNKIADWANSLDAETLGLVTEGYNIRPVDADYWKKNFDRIYLAAEKIFDENFSFTGLDKAQFIKLYGVDLLDKICVDTSFVVEHQDGDIAGFCLCFPDRDTLLVKTMGLVPEHRHSGYMFLAMALHLVSVALPLYKQFCLCLMKEGNFPSRLLEGVVEDQRHFAIYSKSLR